MHVRGGHLRTSAWPDSCRRLPNRLRVHAPAVYDAAMQVAQPLPAAPASATTIPDAPSHASAPPSFTPEAVARVQVDPAAFERAAERRTSPHESGLLAGIVGRVAGRA